MPFVQAKCPMCGGMLAVDDSKKAAICQFCGDAFVVEEAVNNYITYNVTNNVTNNTTNVGEGAVVNIYENGNKDFVIEGGVLKRYQGESVNVVIPEGVIEIGTKCFKNLRIKSVSIPASVECIEGFAFDNCETLEAVYITDLVAWCNIDFIEDNNLFSYADNLYINGKPANDVIIPEGVTQIPADAFSGCLNLTSITIPDSVEDIAPLAFKWCSNLSCINVDENNKVYSSVDGVLFNKDKTVLIQYPVGKADTEYTIPDSVTSIGDAFSHCNSLTSITIPDSVTSIGDYAFSWCESLASITIPNSVTSIGDAAFSGCESLTSITIPDSVTSIGSSAFFDCTSLIDVNISDDLLVKSKHAFPYVLYSKITERKHEAKTQAKQAEKQRIIAERKSKGLCQHCGGTFKKGLFGVKCSCCGNPKDY